jgi:hypothetical protein
MSKIYFVSDCNSLQPAQPADALPNYFAVWLSPDKSFLDLAREKGCENAGEAHFIIEFEVNGKTTSMPIKFGLPAKGWTSYGYPAWIRENNYAQEMGQTLYGATANASLSDHQRKAAEAAYKGIGSKENYFFLYFLHENLQQGGYNKLAVRWYARDLSQPAAAVAGALIAESDIEYGAGASSKAVDTPAATSNESAKVADEILNKASISLIGDLQNLSSLQNGDTFDNSLLIQFTADQPLQLLARELGSEAAGEAHFILSLSVNGETVHVPLKYGTPIKSFKSCAYLAFSLNDQAAQIIYQLSSGNMLGDDDKKAFTVASQTVGRNENLLFQDLLSRRLQVGDNDITVRLSPRDLQRNTEVAPQSRAVAEHKTVLKYDLPAHLKKLLSPEQIEQLDAEATACLAAEKFDEARAIYDRILDGLGEEKYGSPHISYRNKYARVNQVEKELNWARERAEAAEAQRLKEEQEARERAEKEAAERQHVIDNLYVLPREEELGITSPLHEKYLNKIVFAKQVINKDSSEADLSEHFTLHDTIYAKAFLPKSLNNYFNDIGYEYSRRDIVMTYKVANYDKSKMPFWKEQTEIQPYQSGKGNTAIDISILPDSSEFKVDSRVRFDNTDAAPAYADHIKKMLYNLYFLPIGTHQIELDFYINVPADEHDRGYHTRRWRTQFGERFQLAKGTFTVVVDAEGKKALGERIAAHQPPIVQYLPEVEADIMRLLANWKLSDDMTYEILKISTSSDWAYEREGILNLIVSRVIYCDVFVQYSNGYRAMYSSTFRQEHLGNGNFSATRITGSSFYDLLSNESKI